MKREMKYDSTNYRAIVLDLDSKRGVWFAENGKKVERRDDIKPLLDKECSLDFLIKTVIENKGVGAEGEFYIMLNEEEFEMIRKHELDEFQIKTGILFDYLYFIQNGKYLSATKFHG